MSFVFLYTFMCITATYLCSFFGFSNVGDVGIKALSTQTLNHVEN